MHFAFVSLWDVFSAVRAGSVGPSPRYLRNYLDMSHLLGQIRPRLISRAIRDPFLPYLDPPPISAAFGEARPVPRSE